MRIIRTATRMRNTARRVERTGRRIGVVPTMGALHEGHLSLIRRARKDNDIVIVTVFVNPLQFGPHEDFRRYPRRLAQDARLARASGADIVFAPAVEQLYPKGFCTSVDVGALAARWEGASRPGHFRGVATVVAILFELTRPANAYFGQKDLQQSLLIERLAQDLRLPVHVHMLPTVREPDGLAMSSRNAYLNAGERAQARALFGALSEARAQILAGEGRAEVVAETMRRRLAELPHARLDYAAVVDAGSLEPVWRLRGRVALMLAVWIGRTRLIDNLLVDVR